MYVMQRGFVNFVQKLTDPTGASNSFGEWVQVNGDWLGNQ